MSPNREDSVRQGGVAVEALRQTNEENWSDLADKTALTQRQIAMWELAVRYDLKPWNSISRTWFDSSYPTLLRLLEETGARFILHYVVEESFSSIH